MNYRPDFVNASSLNPEVGNVDFRVFTCPTCGAVGKPYTDGQSHAAHGYKLFCSSCRRWLGWSGKTKQIRTEEGERKASSQWSAKRLGITQCQSCLRTLERLGDNEALEVHHVVPIKDGGQDKLENIWVVCTTCHKEIHHRRVYFNGHMEKFFKAYLAVQRMNETRGNANGTHRNASERIGTHRNASERIGTGVE